MGNGWAITFLDGRMPGFLEVIVELDRQDPECLILRFCIGLRIQIFQRLYTFLHKCLLKIVKLIYN